MMDWYGSGVGGAGMVVMIVFWVAIVALIVWLVIRLLPGPDRTARSLRAESALEILDRRLATGEIDAATYSSLRAALTQAHETSK
jgi:putative membrane protein